MKTEAQQKAVLEARTSLLTSPRLAVLTQCTDPADPTTWVEDTTISGGRPIITFANGGVATLDDAGNKYTLAWPLADMNLVSAGGCTPIRLAICEGTGSLATAARSVSDSAFNIGAVPAGGTIKVGASTQVSSEQ